jgi:CHAT domain-containing protein
MRDEAMLTLGRLLETEGSLGHPRLVVLSACETGLYDINRNADEFIGLPATFMQIGATGVLGSLWQVDDLATALLMARFYDLHLDKGVAPSAALEGQARRARRNTPLAQAGGQPRSTQDGHEAAQQATGAWTNAYARRRSPPTWQRSWPLGVRRLPPRAPSRRRR